MGLEWHNRRRDSKGAFARQHDPYENYSLHLHVKGVTYDKLRALALERRTEMSSLVEWLIWRFVAEQLRQEPMDGGRG